MLKTQSFCISIGLFVCLSFLTNDSIWLSTKANILSYFFKNNSAAASLELNKTTSSSSVQTGATFIYYLQYRCASLTENCEGTFISDPLPPEVEFVSVSGSSHTVNESYDSGSHTVTFDFIDPLLSGSTGQVQVEVRFPNGSTPNGVIASNTATIDALNAPAVSSTVDVTSIANAKPVYEKEFSAGGAAGGITSYQLKFCNNSTNGSSNQLGTLTLENIELIDTLPVGSIFVDFNHGSSTSAVYDAASHSVTFSRASLPPGSCMWQRIIVEFPDPPFQIGDTVSNTAFFYSDPVGEPRDTLSSTFDFELTGSNPFAETSKSTSHYNLYQGSFGSYEIRSWVSGTEDLDDFCIVDTIPEGVQINRFSLGGYYYAGLTGPSDRLDLYYTTNLNSATLVPGSPFSIWDEDTYISAEDDLGLVPGVEYITSLSYCFGDVPAGFSMYEDIYLEYNIFSDAPVGIATNCAEITTSTSGITLDEDCANINIIEAYAGALVDPYKTYLGKTASSFHSIGDTLTMAIRLANASEAGQDLIDPSMYDLLPDALTYIPGSWYTPGDGTWNNLMGAPTPLFTEIPNHDGTGRTLLTWSWTSGTSFSFAPDDEYWIRFDVVINSNAPGGNSAIINELSADGGNIVECWGYQNVDIYDFDNDGNILESFCTDSTHINVNPVLSLESEKLVKGQLDTAYTKFPEIGYTVPGGVADYQLIVRNRGNVEIDSVIIIDVLPHVGDTGVIDLSSRLSRWSPNLVGPVNAPSGVTVFYSTSLNPCRSDEMLVTSGPVGCDVANWTVSAPADITTVNSLKFEFGSTILAPNDSIVLNWPMRAPVTALNTIGSVPDSIAWNSFGYIGQRVDNGAYLLATEPVKVGIEIEDEVPAVIGDYVWIDADQNGIQNASEIGFDGMRVELFKDNGDGVSNPAIDTFINFTATANGGFYLFPNLPSGDYFIVYYLPANYSTSSPNIGGNDEIDSDGIISSYNDFDVAISEVTNLSGIEFDLTWDLGIYQNGNSSVGNYIWNDLNNDGVQNESINDGVNGVTVNLYDNANPGVILKTYVTANDANGNPGYYLFDNLIPGDYYLEFVLPTSTTFTSQGGTGISDSNDSDPSDINGLTEVFTLSANEYDDSWDAGLILSGVEECTNGIDDDGDGLVDCDDPDCISSPTIDISDNEVCVNELIDISSSDIGSGTTYTWDFGNGSNPASGSGIGVHNVEYSSCGTKTISLTVNRNSCSLTVDSLINVVDNTSPIWSIAPQDLIMECESIANYPDSISQWLSVLGGGSVSDNCSALAIENNYSGLIPDCGSTGTSTVVFTATDSCGNSATSSAIISIEDNERPFIASVPDVLVECDDIPVAPTPLVVDSCDVSPELVYQEVVVQHPSKNWNSSGSCTLLYSLTSGTYDDKGTVSTIDDEMTFVVTVIGQNTGAMWSANIGGILESGAYYESYLVGPVLSGGSTMSFIISDVIDGACSTVVDVNANDF